MGAATCTVTRPATFGTSFSSATFDAPGAIQVDVDLSRVQISSSKQFGEPRALPHRACSVGS